MERVRLTSMSNGWVNLQKILDPNFPKIGQTDVEVFGTNLLEVMQFVMNHTTFDPSVEMDRALLAAYEPLGMVPGKVFNPTEFPKSICHISVRSLNSLLMKQK